MPERLLLLIDRPEDGRLLSELLSERYEVVSPDSNEVLSLSFDLCILDAPHLEELREKIVARKDSEKPVFLPFLLLAATRKSGRILPEILDIIDDVLSVPIEKIELLAKIKVLLRSRGLSLELKKSAEERIEILERSDVLKDEFLSVISHELRTPLNAIMGFGSILEDEMAGTLTSEQHDYLSKMLFASEKMLDLVSNLLDIARMQAGKFEISKAESDYGSIVKEALADLEPTIKAKDLRLETEIEVDRSVCIDTQRIQQVLLNLVGNAVKFSEKGGKIFVKSWLEGDTLVTEVRDEGLGIALEDLSKLFMPFKQLDMTSTRKTGGFGLGLSICKGLVEAHGGTIVALSEGLNKGSSFVFTLPLGNNSQRTAEAEVPGIPKIS